MSIQNFKPDILYMEVPRCDRCEYWKRQSPVIGYCQRFDRDRYPDVGVIINAGTKFHNLITRGDFGCVQFDSLWREDGKEG